MWVLSRLISNSKLALNGRVNHQLSISVSPAIHRQSVLLKVQEPQGALWGFSPVPLGSNSFEFICIYRIIIIIIIIITVKILSSKT